MKSNKTHKTSKKHSRLYVVSKKDSNVDEKSSFGVVPLLLKDHKKMRSLMKKIKSPRTADGKKLLAFRALELLLDSHTDAEEKSLLNVIKDVEKFTDMSNEGIAEHHLHEIVRKEIRRSRNLDTKVTQVKIFCEMLEHHLDEEEEDLFPKFKDYVALSTRKKLGKRFQAHRLSTKSKSESHLINKALA